MILLIEGHKYCNLSADSKVYKAFMELSTPLEEEAADFQMDYVGYYYSKSAEDVVFFLPKVVIADGKTTIFGMSPEEIAVFDEKKFEGFSAPEHKNARHFLSDLATWIHRTISVYHDHFPDSKIIRSSKNRNHNKGHKDKRHNTLFDVILALRDFNRENQSYLTFVTRTIHSGQNKIHWGKTVANTQAIISDGVPLYLNPITKKKQANFDEELLVIYYSILNYIKEQYGYKVELNVNFDIIKGKAFENLMRGKGERQLKTIKYKYFSDKALMIWNLCFAFFHEHHELALNKTRRDFLLVEDFQIVFERVIDELLSGHELDKKLMEQRDGKRVDHMFVYDSLIHSKRGEQLETYYISDSKYYSREEIGRRDKTEEYEEVFGIRLADKAIYKQFVYSRNVIQYNMNLFLADDDANKKNNPPLRPDMLTEGYNVIPNFFISAYIPDEGEKRFSFKDDKLNPVDRVVEYNRHFENRLFDRDTILLSYYDVNFLFIVSLYGRDRKSDQESWRKKVKEIFRKNVQDKLDELFEFKVLQPIAGKDCYGFIKQNFHRLNGKIYRPNPGGERDYLVLATLKDSPDTQALFRKMNIERKAVEILADSKVDLSEIKSYFTITHVDHLDDLKKVKWIANFGTLEEQKEEGKKCVFTALVRKSDKDYLDFRNHVAQSYIMEKIPTGINILDAKFLLPMVGGKIDGYYSIEKIAFSTRKVVNEDGEKMDKLRLRILLSTYVPMGKEWVDIYREKMQPGELLTMEDMRRLYDPKEL